ncbi:MAG: cardiolipin synthase [bacterium]|nr:cardiolipin synthase [bacterium]
MWNFLVDLWPILLGAVSAAVAVGASAHVVLYKRNPRSAIAWVGLIWLAPLLGAVLYGVLGVNRIRRRAQRTSLATRRSTGAAGAAAADDNVPDTATFQEPDDLRGLARLVGELTGRSLLPGNEIVPYINGDEAYPPMLAAIEAAQRSVTLCSFIFDNDRIGRQFVEALQRATQRGVAVRVLVDGVGAWYSRPSPVKVFNAYEIPVRTFLPTRLPRMLNYTNLRNHRKILVVDGQVGFTGGMNIREGNQIELQPRHPIQDVHFRLRGPVVAHLQEVFALDWVFSGGEPLEGELWFPQLDRAGDAWARGISDGPDEDIDQLRLSMLGALAAARSTVHVVTPYFLPDIAIITALNVAAMRGVKVQIVLPAVNNIRPVHWACMSMLWQVLERGCRVWLTPPPFDHTKLLIVDGTWSLVGSANWDPRSLRLNFEFDVECYDAALAGALIQVVEAKIAEATEFTYDDAEGRSLPVRLRDGMARLLYPFL